MARQAVRQIGVEGSGRVFTHKGRQARSQSSRHEAIVKAVKPNLPLLRHRQHEIATRSAVAALSESASPSLSSPTTGTGRTAQSTARWFRLSFTEGFRSFRCSSAGFLEGAVLKQRAGHPNAAQSELDRQRTLHTVL